jgi:hypothetical protein
MVWSQCPLKQPQRAAIEAARLGESALELVQDSEVVEQCRDQWAVAAAGRFRDGDGLAVERLCLAIAAPDSADSRQSAEGLGQDPP